MIDDIFCMEKREVSKHIDKKKLRVKQIVYQLFFITSTINSVFKDPNFLPGGIFLDH
jgi:hypothetical protein